MDSSQEFFTSSLDELRRIELDARRTTSLDELRASFERVQVLRRLHPNDFDLQLFISEVQEQILERARELRSEPRQPRASVPMTENTGRLPRGAPAARTPAAPQAPAELAEPMEPPPGVERVDIKTWQRAIWIGLFFCVIVLSAFWYLIMTARRLYFSPAGYCRTDGRSSEQWSKEACHCRTHRASRRVHQARRTALYRLGAGHGNHRRECARKN